jgi:hypothetical protein
MSPGQPLVPWTQSLILLNFFSLSPGHFGLSPGRVPWTFCPLDSHLGVPWTSPLSSLSALTRSPLGKLAYPELDGCTDLVDSLLGQNSGWQCGDQGESFGECQGKPPFRWEATLKWGIARRVNNC